MNGPLHWASFLDLIFGYTHGKRHMRLLPVIAAVGHDLSAAAAVFGRGGGVGVGDVHCKSDSLGKLENPFSFNMSVVSCVDI